MRYRQCNPDKLSNAVYTVMRFNDDDSTSGIQFNPSNMDYQKFIIEINEGTSELEDVDGNLLSKEDAILYVSTLPI